MRKLWNDRSGAVAVTAALSLLPLSLAAIGALDLHAVNTTRNRLQDALDAATLAAARDGEGVPSAVTAIGADMLANAMPASALFDAPSASFTVTDQGDGVSATATAAVHATLLDKVTGAPLTVQVHSKALRRDLDVCVAAFNRTIDAAIDYNGSAAVDLRDCTAYANSSSRAALTMNGSSSLAAKAVNLVGGANLQGGLLKAPLRTGAPRFDDPFAQVQAPSAFGCNQASPLLVDHGASFQAPGAAPYVFCGGLQVTGGTVAFGPGVYIVRGGPLIFNGNTQVRGSGVTFVLEKGATVRIDGGADVRLSAPRQGALRRLLFFGDRAPAEPNIFNGGATQRLEGVLYFPAQHVRFNGDTDFTGGCLSLFADTIEWTGNADFSLAGCAPMNDGVWLVE